MYFYFSADFNAGIKLNGIYYGTITNTVKNICIEEPQKTLVELLYLNEIGGSFNFLLDNDFLSHPQNACVTDLKGGYLINFFNKYSSDVFKIICQEKFHDAVVTVFIDKGLKLSIETPNGFFADTFEIFSENCQLKRFNIDDSSFIAVILDNKYIHVYCIDNAVNKVFSDSVCDYSFDGGFYSVKKYNDMAKHVVKTYWGYNGEILFAQSNEISHSPHFIRDNLPDKLLPYAFLEDFLAEEDFSFYLSQNVSKNADKLKGYLKDFIGIMPPPPFREQNQVGLIYRIDKNLYNVEYFSFLIVNGKIDNIKKHE